MSTVVMGTPISKTLVFDDCERRLEPGMSHQMRNAIATRINKLPPATRKEFIADLLQVIAEGV